MIQVVLRLLGLSQLLDALNRGDDNAECSGPVAKNAHGTFDFYIGFRKREPVARIGFRQPQDGGAA